MDEMKYKIDDIVLAESFAGVDVLVQLKERVEVPPHKGTKIMWEGYSGWNAKLVRLCDAKKLQDSGVPIKLGDKTWVYDWQIINKKKEYEKENSR